MNIFLIGYRCTGKTSVGKRLAENLRRSFLDSDAEIVRDAGMTVSEIVAKSGWAGFRELEKAVVQRICELDDHVVATGGGVILDRENVARMKKSGAVIWLRATFETVERRMNADSQTKDQRPALTSNSQSREIRETLSVRLPLYETAMDFFIDTDNVGINDICGVIEKKLGTNNRSDGVMESIIL